MAGGNEVVVEKFIKADAARIYRAFTEPAELRKWFFTDATTDPRPGGGYRIHWRSEREPSRDHERFGRYISLVPNEEIVFEWNGPIKAGGEALPPTLVTVTLTPQTGGTLVRLVHSGWPDTEAGRALKDSHQSGWTFYTDNLRGHLEGEDDRRREHFGQLVQE